MNDLGPRTGSDRHRLLLLIVILAAVAATATLVSVVVLYRAAVEENRARLSDTAKTQARLLEATARSDAEPGRWRNRLAAFYATLRKFEDAYGTLRRLGKSGELTLARREGDTIAILLGPREPGRDPPDPIPLDANRAEPLRRALAGESGTLIGPDYRGISVLAAYEPVAVLDLALVAKIDMAEIRAPFVRAGLLAAGTALVLTVLGSLLFHRVTAPLLRNLERRVEQRTRELAENRARLRSLASELIRTEERERRRIASDLHDQIGQILALIRMKIGALAGASGEAGEAGLAEIATLVDQVAGSVRTLTFELSPPVLYELGLTAGLEWLAEQIEARHGLPVEVTDDGKEMPLSEDMRALLFRSIRELLLNVVKHAKATSASVALWQEDGDLHAEVADDGVGFDPAVPPTPGFGLFSVRERLESVGGTLTIDSPPSSGTRIHILLRHDIPAKTDI